MKPKEVHLCITSFLQVLGVLSVRLKDPNTPQMTKQNPGAPKQFGIRLSEEVMEQVTKIQELLQKNNQSTTLSTIVEDAISIYYDQLVDEGSNLAKK